MMTSASRSAPSLWGSREATTRWSHVKIRAMALSKPATRRLPLCFGGAARLIVELIELVRSMCERVREGDGLVIRLDTRTGDLVFRPGVCLGIRLRDATQAQQRHAILHIAINP